MNKLRWMPSIIVVMMLLLAGCFLSVEQRWEKIDEQMQQEIGVKTKDYYVSEWGNPAKRVKAADGKHSMQVFILRLGWWPFSMLKVQRSNYDPDFKELAEIKRKYWVASSIIEPQRVQSPEAYKKAGYRLTRFPYLAVSTYLND